MTEVTKLADEFVEALFDAEPLWPAVLGIESVREGIGDLSEVGEAKQRTVLKDFVSRALALQPETAEDRTTRDVLVSQARGYLDRISAHGAEYTVTDMFVAPAAGLLTMLPMIGIGTQTELYLGRLAAIPEYLEQAAERHRSGVAAGRVPVEHLVRNAIAHLDRYLADPTADPLLRQPAPDEDFAKRRAELLETLVRPAFARYRDVLADEIVQHGRPADKGGLCWLPDGERMYAAFARAHTTTERSPDDLHETGLRIIEELAGEYAVLGSRVFGTAELPEIFERLRTDPELRWRDEDELLESARAAISRAEAASPQWFGRIPPHPWVVEAVPAAEAPGAPTAFYLQPSVDGSRPGTYFANTYEVTERFRHTSEVIAFHEAIPGHHFQLSTALTLTDLPLLRRIGDFTAYAEGWGLYTERLADEMGLYSSDLTRLGMLTMDSMRAGRLVVDTGLHAKGWSREQGVAFLREHTPMPQVEIDNEVDRYLAYPGQALSYMVGRLEILRIREQAKRALGERFDIRAFHDVVLGGGALPMSVLDAVVTAWVEEQGA
ncbi:uncharacterized protein (DUF885 family) [Amycolatopsis bartoniae]|uniref:DUF885 domain-containing protein n=1 Tax=Amycolatopsis bartoniae TaxID=941986 RepID=UPI00118F2941|nr:DUF885 domain-containing protein [Amycolatopsis bartoniae]MBB2935408.1 uncharacterized protein (DUF885 family) [Amycolatopsis bartoniae]TVT03722.1 DUF885 domain-containing protein [Amycolatopsis bartoniae]